jgi:hypothetical protein
MGFLHEREKRPDRKMVAECYNGALLWSSVPSKDGSAIGEPAEYTLASEWDELVESYMRVKAAVENT